MPRQEWTFGQEGTPAVGNAAAISVVLHPAGTIGGCPRIRRSRDARIRAMHQSDVSWLPAPRGFAG